MIYNISNIIFYTLFQHQSKKTNLKHRSGNVPEFHSSYIIQLVQWKKKCNRFYILHRLTFTILGTTTCIVKSSNIMYVITVFRSKTLRLNRLLIKTVTTIIESMMSKAPVIVNANIIILTTIE